jgi:hypothetical protein
MAHTFQGGVGVAVRKNSSHFTDEIIMVRGWKWRRHVLLHKTLGYIHQNISISDSELKMQLLPGHSPADNMSVEIFLRVNL